MTKYRICKNKYGYYKIQEEVISSEYKEYAIWLCSAIDLILLLLLPITIMICAVLMIINIDYEEILFKNKIKIWQDLWQQEVYTTRKEVESKIQEMVDFEIEQIQRNNNEWECQGEI